MMRNDDAPDIRALLRSEADSAPRPAGMTRAGLRKARIQRSAVAFASVFGIVLLVTGVGFAATWLTGERDPTNIASEGWVAIADVEQLQDEGVVYDPTHLAFAVWNDGQPLVLSALVPHLPDQEERALFCTTSLTFGGPHGEQFDRRGYYLEGPAPRGLDRYRSRIEEGAVEFDPRELVEGPARGEVPALELAGPLCTEDHTERAPGFAAIADHHPELESEFQFEPYPGNSWHGPDGEPVEAKSGIINVIQAPEHCDWESAAMMHVGWPLGHDAADASESRQYLRDPEEVFADDMLMTSFDADVDLPPRADYTGYRTDFMQLWLEEEDDTAAYLVFADHVERWPRAEDVIACA